jgi:hypothetical protein
MARREARGIQRKREERNAKDRIGQGTRSEVNVAESRGTSHVTRVARLAVLSLDDTY